MDPGADIGETYLEWALDLTAGELKERSALLERLPARLVDCHAHVNSGSTVGSLSAYAWAQARSSFPVWTLPDSDGVRSFLYGEHHVMRLLMAHPYRGIDHRRANDYLLTTATPDDRVILCGLPDDREYTVGQLMTGRYVGLKMYPHYREPPYKRVEEYFPKWALIAAADAGLPAIVHLPLPLADCIFGLLELVRKNPDTRFVLAHLGRQNTVDSRARAAFEAAAAYPQVSVDTSMASDRLVHDLALATFGPDRVLYGSDEPFNLLRYVQFQHPVLGHRLVGPQRYHWLDETMFNQYRHLARDAHLVHLQVLRALIDTVDKQFEDEAPTVLERIFHDNALAWFPTRRDVTPPA